MGCMANMNSIGDYIRQQREQAKISLRQLADQAGVSNPYLSQIERGLRKPSADILQQIAKGLRISAEALYVQAGILEDHPGDSGVRSALLTDPQLTERQKQVLIEIYESFRKEGQKAPTAEVVAVLRGDRPAPGAEAPAAAASAFAGSAPADAASSAPPAGHAAPPRPEEFPKPSDEADIPPANPSAAEPPNGDAEVSDEPPAGPSSSWGDATDAV
jgi:transcriptional regulator with XRE-family HTH domain